MIRAFQPSDMEDVLQIWLDASIKAHDFIDKGFWQSKVGDMRTIYLPSAETYVFSENGTIKGFFSLCGDTLAAVFVAPAAQGEGIGKRLLAKAQALRSRLDLTVYRDNRSSVDFYKRCGFRMVEERVDRHTGHAEIVMAYSR